MVAREKLTNGRASAPVTVVVRLGDVNDNPPLVLPHPAVTVQAGTQRRTIASLAATDPDLEDRVRWSLVRVEPRYYTAYRLEVATPFRVVFIPTTNM